MEIVVVALGLVLVAVTNYDATITTLAPGTAAGPLTRWVGRGLWRGVHRVADGPASRLLVATGPLALVATLGTWIAVLVAGWSLVFGALASAELTTPDGAPVTVGGAIYFAVTTLFTLGPGDVVPLGGLGHVLTSLALVNGMVLVTMAITYLVPVVGAVTDRRIQAATLSGYGTTAPAIRTTLAAGAEAYPVDDIVRDAATAIQTTAQRHLTYPVVHFFHSADRETAFAPAVAAFTEAVLALDSPEHLHEATRRSYLSALDDLLDVAEHHLRVAPPAEPPSALPGSTARTGDRSASGPDPDLRRRLLAFVEDSGWSWADVAG